MLRRLLNIASIVCLVLCVVLMGMWVWSYWCGYRLDWISAGKREFIVESVSGHVRFTYIRKLGVNAVAISLPFWRVDHWPPGETVGAWKPRLEFVAFNTPPGGFLVGVPHWFLVLTSGSLAMVFRLQWPPRFTLRSLFIATTFLAVVLGMIAWLDRAWIGK